MAWWMQHLQGSTNRLDIPWPTKLPVGSTSQLGTLSPKEHLLGSTIQPDKLHMQCWMLHQWWG